MSRHDRARLTVIVLVEIALIAAFGFWLPPQLLPAWLGLVLSVIASPSILRFWFKAIRHGAGDSTIFTPH